jgi:hypothetical protein
LPDFGFIAAVTAGLVLQPIENVKASPTFRGDERLVKPAPQLKLVRCPRSLSAIHHATCVDHSYGPVLAPATLAALPSTRAIPDRDVFYVAFPKSSIPSIAISIPWCGKRDS